MSSAMNLSHLLPLVHLLLVPALLFRRHCLELGVFTLGNDSADEFNCNSYDDNDANAYQCYFHGSTFPLVSPVYSFGGNSAATVTAAEQTHSTTAPMRRPILITMGIPALLLLSPTTAPDLPLCRHDNPSSTQVSRQKPMCNQFSTLFFVKISESCVHTNRPSQLGFYHRTISRYQVDARFIHIYFLAATTSL